MPAHYLPPYDSPIEDKFAYFLTKYIAGDVKILPQFPAETICGRFVIDFVLISPEIGRVAIECDGREFHDDRRDEWRDAMILGHQIVDSVYRLRGSDINFYIEDVLFLLSRLEPGLMSARGSTNLNTLVSIDAKVFPATRDEDRIRIRYQEPEEGSLLIEVRRFHVPEGQRRFWQAAFRFAKSVGGGQLETVMQRYVGT
jgi:hypothetical protein